MGGPLDFPMSFDAFRAAERDGWDARAAGYEQHTALATLQIAPAMLAALRLRPGLDVLDLACGPGHVAGAAAALGCRTLGIDFAPAMIDAARARFPGLAFDVGDAQALAQPDAGFDAVACNMGLFHMTDPARAMTEAARVLRPGGRFSFSQWAAPDASALYGALFGILREEADLSRADPAPDAYVLSDTKTVTTMMETSGFARIEIQHLPTTLIATGADFVDFFIKFGVRVPLILAAQDAPVQARIRERINAAMDPYRTEGGFEVPMPSLLFTGEKPCI